MKMIQRFGTGFVNAKGTAPVIIGQLEVKRPFIMKGLHVGAYAYDTPNTYFLPQNGSFLQVQPQNVAVTGGLQDASPSTQWTVNDWEFNLINLQFGRGSSPFMFDRYINSGAVISLVTQVVFEIALITAGDNCDVIFSMWWEEVTNDGTQGIRDIPFKLQDRPYLKNF